MPKRVDANQPDIVAALRRAGCSVQSLAMVGHGVPDLLVGRHGDLFLLEVKDGAKPPSKQKLTQDEIEWIAKWDTTVFIVTSTEEALMAVGLMG